MENVSTVETALEIPPTTKLNKQQLEMLRVFQNPFSEEDFLTVKRQIVQILNRRLQEELARLDKENGWTAETYEQWGHDHDRISTDK
jgi:hypothetical protein